MVNATVQADPHLRRRALILVFTVLVTGALFLYYFHGYLRDVEALATASPQLAGAKLSLIQQVTKSVVLCSAIVLAALLSHVAFRVLRAAQWPPPGFRVVWDMPIRTGRQAIVVAAFFLFLAVSVIADAVLMMNLPGPVPKEQEVPMREV